jgi:hypothetical protein
MRDGETRGGKEEEGEEANDCAHQQLHSVWVSILQNLDGKRRLNRAEQLRRPPQATLKRCLI